jgi:flagellar hook-associated protein 3 FlgL
MIFNQSVTNINKHYEKIYKLNEQVSSGKRINRPSDDSLDSGKVLDYRNMLSSIDQYTKNVNRGIALLRNTESALAGAEQIFIDAKVLAEQMATGTYTAEQRDMLSVQAEHFFGRLMVVGNTKVTDRYIFSGYKTDTKTFTRDDYYNISYHGDNNQIQFEIQQNTKVTVNSTGQKVFIDGTNTFDVLRDLRNALKDNDQEAVGEVLERINDALNQIVRERAIVGVALHEMESSKNILVDFGLQTVELLSNTEDTDIIDVLSKLKMREIAFGATLQSTSMVTGLSLVNFL